MTPAAALLPFLLLLLHHLSVAASISGLDSFLTQQSTRDPQATNDSFMLLPSSIRKSLSHAFHPTTTSSLLSLQLSVPLTVHLVGPTFSDSAASILSAFISAALSSDFFHVITPFSSDAASHHLSISHSLHHEVFLSSSSLSNSLSAALDSHLSLAPSSLRSHLSSVPYSVVDSIIKQDFEKERPINSIHIYIIHLGSHSQRYAYSYTSGDPSPAITKCLGSIWTGKDRYLWIDLGAWPVDYGPALSGDGVLPKGEFHPFATLHGRPKSQKSLLSDLASLVWSAYQVLLVPSLRIPVPFESTSVVELVHIHGSHTDDSNLGLDWKSIERTFMDEVNDNGLLLGEQSLIFRKYEVNFSMGEIKYYN